MRRTSFSVWMRMTAVLAAVATGGTALLTVPAQGNLIHEARERSKPHPVSELPSGKTDKLSAAQWKAVDAARAKALRPKPKLRLLTKAEMGSARGRGPYRNRAFIGALPWQKSLRDVNLCNGNLFKSFTDMQVSPARGAGLAMQRTYNSNDERVGPFGIGWTHAYDIRMEEDPTNTPTDDSLNFADRTDFFGAKHKYHRDADGLYSPPAYLYDEMSSDYDKFLTDGPQNVLSDTERGMDGTVKHFTKVGNERVCDSMTDRYNNSTVLAYNTVSIAGVSKALLSAVTDPSSRTLSFTWQDLNAADTAHPAWRIVRVDGPQYAVAYAYNADFNLSACTLDAGDAAHLNRTTTYAYTTFGGIDGTETGLLSSITDSLGRSVSYVYSMALPDGFGGTVIPITGTMWVQSVTEPGGVDASNTPRSLVWTIGLNPDIHSITDISNSSGLKMGVGWDNNLRFQTYFPVDGVDSTQGVLLDSANNVLTKSESHLPTGGGAYGRYDRFDYFTYGPHGNQLSHQVSGFDAVETTTYYNASQYFQKASVTDMNGRTSTLGVGSSSDPNPGNRGNVLWVRDAGYGDANSPSYQKQFNYAYSSFGQKVNETNENGVATNYSYGDEWGNLTQVVQDPHVSQGDSHLARTTSMVYDIGGHILSSVDQMSRNSTFAFNVLGQPLTVSMPVTAATAAETITYGYDSGGRTLSVRDNRGATTMVYEAGSDRVHSVTDPVTGTMSYTYGLSGERASMTLPGGGTWTYGYAGPTDGQNAVLPKEDPNSLSWRLLNITDDQGRRAEYVLDFLGHPRAAFTNQTFTTATPPVRTSYCETDYLYDLSPALLYHSNFRLQRMSNSFHSMDGNGQWHSRLLTQNDYTFDASGQRLTNTISSLDTTGNPVSRTEQYGFDALNRLKTVDYGDGQTQAYSFDAMGNRLQKQDSASGTENYSYNSANMLLTRGANNYSNDAEGNTLTGGGRTNTWDSQNRLVQCVNGANTSSFVYGADGIRRQSTVNGAVTDFVLDNSMFVRERNHTSGASLATYLVGGRGPEYRRDEANGEVRWYLYDGLGSVLGEIDPNGNVTSSRKYDVYGLVRGGSNPGGTSSHKFVGQLGHPSEDHTGLIYMRARYCDPVVGRFVSEDPAAKGTNWYAYTNNDPVNYTDKTGKRLSSLNDGDFTGAFGWFLLANAFLYFYFSAKYGWKGAAYCAIALAMGAAYLIADALQDMNITSDVGTSAVISSLIGAMANGAYSKMSANASLTGIAGWFANVAVGMIVYYGICELYAWTI